MEPMGMVVAEGLACGCRMVVSNQGGMPEVGGEFCRYFENGNVDSLVEALRVQLTTPIWVAAEALQTHLAKFTVEYSASELEKWLMQ
jgi:glycosyltransferase involved in cell wall biosynthesis